jgi:hypothetical protein
MPKGQKKPGNDNQPKLSVKEKSDRKAAKKAKIAPTIIPTGSKR